MVGLANPGETYRPTRHNAGAWFVDEWMAQSNTVFKNEKSLQSDLAWIAPSVRVMKPRTYMNHSGASVRAVSSFYRIKPEEILVVHDELDLPVGTIKLKTSGGHGGHNGLRDVIAQLGTQDFHRLRVGIGHPGHRDLVHDYVLGRPTTTDKQLIDDAMERAIKLMPLVLSGQFSLVMNQLH